MQHLLSIELVPGMVVGEDVLTNDYKLVLPKGTVLTDDNITKLTLYGILSIYVEDVVPHQEETVSQQTSFSSHIKETKEFQEFKQQYDAELDSFRNAINDVVENNAPLDVANLVVDALNIVSTAKGKLGVLNMLHHMREYDDSTFAHSLNVALLSNVLAGWLGLSEEQIEMATACGLLHDVGKLLVPQDIITKPGKLTPEEFNVIKGHPYEGYQLLRRHEVDSHICNTALMHHERLDGSGYPLGLTGNKIDFYARMIAICDVYDAMTAARCYRGPMCPFKVVEIFEKEGLQKYDVTFVLVFLEYTVNTYLNNRCRLSDGREGDIIYINKNHLSRPTIISNGETIDLIKEKNIQIDALI